MSAPVFLIAGALVVRPSNRPRPRAFTVLTAGGSRSRSSSRSSSVWLGAHWSGQAAAAVGVNDARAITLAKRARQLNPLSLDPLYQAAAAEVDQGAVIKRMRAKGWRARYRAVNEELGYYTKATRAPARERRCLVLARLLPALHAELPARGVPAFNHATTLDPRNPL